MGKFYLRGGKVEDLSMDVVISRVGWPIEHVYQIPDANLHANPNGTYMKLTDYDVYWSTNGADVCFQAIPLSDTQVKTIQGGGSVNFTLSSANGKLWCSFTDRHIMFEILWIRAALVPLGTFTITNQLFTSTSNTR